MQAIAEAIGTSDDEEAVRYSAMTSTVDLLIDETIIGVCGHIKQKTYNVSRVLGLWTSKNVA